jgi:phospholipid/cholesterol/gamma-HCH transport system substrate-binding protein
VVSLLLLGLITWGAFNAENLALLGGSRTYQAEFSEAAGLASDDPVTIAGVTTGRVTRVALAGDRVLVNFRVDNAWVGDRSTASIQIRTVLGGKSLAVDPQGDAAMEAGARIPLDRTASPYDIVDALNGLTANINALDTEQLARSLDTLATEFQNTPPHVRGALDGLSRLSRTVAGRDAEIRSLLANTRKVTDVLAAQTPEVEKLISDGNVLLAELKRRQEAIADLIDGTLRLSVELRGLVADNADQLGPTLEQLDRVVATLQRNADNLNRFLPLEAVFVRLFSNAVGNGRWFDNFVCNLPPVALDDNGPGCTWP